MSTENLELLNSFRVADGKAPFADWRKARHQPMLDAYMATAEAEQAQVETPVAPKSKGKKAQPATTEKGESYKHLARRSGKTSAVGTPVQYVHQFLAENPDLSRKEAITSLVSAGVNFSTARTQYQKWFAANKKG